MIFQLNRFLFTSNLLLAQIYLITECFEPFHRLFLRPLSIQSIQVPWSQVLIRFLLFKNMIDNHSDTMGAGHSSLRLDHPTGKTMVLGGEVIVLHATETPTHFS